MNAGPLAYASAFLGGNAIKYPEDLVQQLEELFRYHYLIDKIEQSQKSRKKTAYEIFKESI